jgi:alpha-L-fucosidase
MFIHLGMNTFTGREWGTGTERPALFNPGALDATQWVRVAKESGFKYVILTAKHHDGFCLWPSKYTTHSIRHSPSKGGNGDVVREFADACHQAGVKFGVYLAAWDMHEPSYGTDAYNIYYRNQLIELLTNYGEVGEVRLDAADGIEPGGVRQAYDWNLYYSTIRACQPNALIAAFGPDIRVIGNEKGIGNTRELCAQPPNILFHGREGGSIWYPSECDVSIRPGWFYHSFEDGKIKTIRHLVDIYVQSVGRNSNLLLNVPPTPEGILSTPDVTRLKEWTARRKQMFENDLLLHRPVQASNTRYDREEYSAQNCVDGNRSTFWAADKDTLRATLTVELAGATTINMIKMEEAIQFGQRIKSFSVYGEVDGSWILIAAGTTIGRTRIIQFPAVTTARIRLSIDEAEAAPTIRTWSAYYVTP